MQKRKIGHVLLYAGHVLPCILLNTDDKFYRKVF